MLWVYGLWEDKLKGEEEVATLTCVIGHAGAGKGEFLPWLGTLRDAQGSIAFQGGHLHEAAEGGIPRQNINHGIEVITEEAENMMAGISDGEDEVAALSGNRVFGTFAVNKDFEAGMSERRNLYVKGREAMARRVGLIRFDGDGMNAALDGLFKGDFENGVGIKIFAVGTFLVEIIVPALWLRLGLGLWVLGALAYRLRFGTGFVGVLGFESAGGIEPLVVILPFFGIGQNGMGFFDEEKDFMSFFLIVGDIWVKLEGEAPEGLAYFLGRGGGLNLQALVIILEDESNHGAG